MTAAALIDSLEDQGLFLWASEGRLQFIYEGDQLPPSLRQQVVSHRSDLLHRLGGAHGVSLRGLPQAYWLGEDPAFSNATPAFLHLVYAGGIPVAETLQRALDALVEMHPPLAYTLDDKEPRLLVTPSCRPLIDLADAVNNEPARRCASLPDAQRAISRLGAGLPLFRLVIVDDGHERCLHAVFRLVLFDAPSVHIFMRDLMLLVSATKPLALPDYAADARATADQRRQACDMRRLAKAYWDAQLTKLPGGPSLPRRRPVGPASEKFASEFPATPRFLEHRYRLPADRYLALARQAQSQGVTVNVALISAYMEVLARWSGKTAVCVSAMLSNRVAAGGLDDRCIGNRGDILLLGLSSTLASFCDRARALQADLAAALKHRAYDGVSVMRRWVSLHDSRRSSAEPPLPYVFSSLLGTPLAELSLEQSDHRMLTPQIWIDAQAYEHGGDLWLTWDELEGVFEAGVVEQAFAAFTQTVAALSLAADAWQSSELQLPDEVTAAMNASNDTQAVFPPGVLFGGLFEQAGNAATAHRVAAVCGDRSLTFYQLASQATQLAAHLNENGVGPSDHVVVRGAKSLETLVAIYAVVIAGATYVPVTPGTPVMRVHAINRQAAATTVLGDDDDDIARVTSSPVMWTINYAQLLRELPSDIGIVAPAYPVEVTHLAYIIFTSGSTGVPKGVAVTHAAALNTLHDCRVRFQITPDDRLLALSELSFDLSVFDLFMPVLAGCTVVLPPVPEDDSERTDPGIWLAAANRSGATVWNSVPSLMELALSHARAHGERLPATLRLWMASGDWIPVTLPGRVRAHLPEARFVSLGGATEAAIWSNTFEVTEVEPHWSSIPYGRPMANQRFHVLDEAGRRCPPSVAGMLHIAGAGLAQGYVNDPERTAQAFFHHEVLNDRLYRTGDLGRYGQDGVLELLGRVDEQVKISGFRVELAELEAVLGQHPMVAQCAAVAVGAKSTASLFAFVVPAKGASGSTPDLGRITQEVESFAAKRLNHYMLPARWLYLSSLPLNVNGKVDKRSLREMADAVAGGGAVGNGLLLTQLTDSNGSQSARGSGQPSGGVSGLRHDALEQAVSLAASAVLGSSVRADENWFERGLTSLQAVYLLHSLNERLGSELRLADIYRHSSSSSLVSRFVQGQVETPNLIPLRLAPISGLPLLILVHPVGGSVSCYLPLAQELSDRFHVVALSAELDSTFKSLPAMAAHYLPQLRKYLTALRPVVFAGWSMGGIVALEMARLALEAGEVRCSVATVDSMIPSTPGATVADDELMRAYESDLQANYSLATVNAPLMTERLNLFRANYGALLQYEYRPLACPEIHGFASEKTQMPGLCSLASVASGAVCERLVGDHRTVMDSSNLSPLVALLVQALVALKGSASNSESVCDGDRSQVPFVQLHQL